MEAAHHLNSAPVFSSGTAIKVVQGNIATGYAAVATDTDAVTYNLSGGADQTAFSIDSVTGVLSFKMIPDFDAPSDINEDNNYVVEITASDSKGASMV